MVLDRESVCESPLLSEVDVSNTIKKVKLVSSEPELKDSKTIPKGHKNSGKEPKGPKTKATKGQSVHFLISLLAMKCYVRRFKE